MGTLDIQQSITYIETRGSALEKARLSCILHGDSPSPDTAAMINDMQNGDGGFPFKLQAGNLSTLNETTVALWWMEELNMLSLPAAGKAFGYLVSAQQEEGSWEEDVRIAQYDLPPWIQLGDRRTKLYLSAYASYWLAAGGYTHIPAFRKATHFLIRNQEESGRFYGYLHTTWIATGVFLMAGERYANIVDHALQALSAIIPAEWADSQVAWALDCLSRGGLQKSHPFVGTFLAELVRRQAPDGSWSSEDGESFAVGATLQVLKVMKRYGYIPEINMG